MNRTQIYLHDALHERLKTQAQMAGISMSELIRRLLDKAIKRDPVAEAHSFFEQLAPLQSFADTSADAYVAAVRSRSRLLRGEGLPNAKED